MADNNAPSRARNLDRAANLGVISFKWDNDDKKIAQAFQMLGLFIWYLGIWLGNQMTEPTMPVTWNHRVLVFEEHGEKSYCIHEVHYDDDGSILGWTANAIAVCSMRRT